MLWRSDLKGRRVFKAPRGPDDLRAEKDGFAKGILSGENEVVLYIPLWEYVGCYG